MFAKKTKGEKSSPQIIKTSRDWEEDRTFALEKSEARAWIIARVGLALAVLSVGAVLVLVPFYKVHPVTFEVDRATGEVLQVQVGPESVKQTEMVDKYFVSRYVQMRERYVWTLLQEDFDSVMELSDETVSRDYRVLYDDNNPNALDKKLGETTTIRVSVLSVELSPRDPGRAVVRWERVVRKNGNDGPPERYNSTLAFKYEPAKAFTREKKLLANPMGFRVTGYAVSSELTAPPQR